MDASDYNVWHIIISAIVVIVVGLFSVFWVTGQNLSDTLSDHELLGALALTTLFLIIIGYFFLSKKTRGDVDSEWMKGREFAV